MGRKSLVRQEWFLVLIVGICVFVFGVTASLYLLAGISNLSAFIPIFFAGWGFGYIICSFTLRKWEKRSWEIDIKARVDEQPKVMQNTS
jgi:uncharacterized membrane protein HdeD (DUF308 family)